MDEDLLFVLGTSAPWAAASVSAIAETKLACSPSARLAVVAAGSLSAVGRAAWKDTVADLQTDTWAALPRAKDDAAAAAASAAAGIREWLAANATLRHCAVRAVVIADGSHAPSEGEICSELAAAVDALATELRTERCFVDCLIGWGPALKAKPDEAEAAKPSGDAPPRADAACPAAASSPATANAGHRDASSATAKAEAPERNPEPDAGAAAPTEERGRAAAWPEEVLLDAARRAGGQPPAIFVARSALELWDACAALAASPGCRCVGQGAAATAVAVGSLVHKFASARKALAAASE